MTPQQLDAYEAAKQAARWVGRRAGVDRDSCDSAAGLAVAIAMMPPMTDDPVLFKAYVVTIARNQVRDAATRNGRLRCLRLHDIDKTRRNGTTVYDTVENLLLSRDPSPDEEAMFNEAVELASYGMVAMVQEALGLSQQAARRFKSLVNTASA